MPTCTYVYIMQTLHVHYMQSILWEYVAHGIPRSIHVHAWDIQCIWSGGNKGYVDWPIGAPYHHESFKLHLLEWMMQVILNGPSSCLLIGSKDGTRPQGAGQCMLHLGSLSWQKIHKCYQCLSCCLRPHHITWPIWHETLCSNHVNESYQTHKGI